MCKLNTQYLIYPITKLLLDRSVLPTVVGANGVLIRDNLRVVWHVLGFKDQLCSHCSKSRCTAYHDYCYDGHEHCLGKGITHH